MSGAVLEARAVIKAEDQTKAAFESVKARIAGIARQVEGMDRALNAVGGPSKNVNAIQTSMGRTVADMERLVASTRAVGDASKNIKTFEQSLVTTSTATATAQRNVVSLTEALKQEDAALRLARDAMAEAGQPTERLVAEQERLAGVINTTTQAIERQSAAEGQSIQVSRRAAEIANKAARDEQRAQLQRDEHIRKHGVVNYLAMGAAGYLGAHGMATGIEDAVVQGANLQHERVGLLNAGRSPEEIQHIEETSKAVVAKLPTATYLDNLKVIAETTQAFGSVEHATNNLEFMQKTMSVLHSAAGDKIQGGPGEVGQAMAKTFEERLTKPENFQNEASQMIPAMVASGGVFNPNELYAFAQQAKSSLPNYDMHFLSRIAPSLITAMRGERAGTAANAFTSIIMGKVNDKKQAEAWLKAGLLDPSKVLMKAGHAVGWSAGAVKNTDLALTDPLAWSESTQIPAFEKMGIDMSKRLDVAKQLGTMYRNANGQMFATEITQEQSRARLHKDDHLYGQVGGLDDIYNRNLQSDPTVAVQALKASIENLMSSVTSPAMTTAAAGITKIAEALNALAGAAQNHPLAAMLTGGGLAAAGLAGSGYLGYKMMTGFGLNEAATALTASAEALDVAAARLGVGGGASGLPGKLASGAAAAAGAGVLVTSAAIGAGLGIMGGSIYALSHDGTPVVSGGRTEPKSQRDTDHPGHWVYGRGGLREWAEDSYHPGITIIEGAPESAHSYTKDYTLGRFDHDFLSEPSDGTPVGMIAPVSRMRANRIAGAGFGANDSATVSLDPNSKATIDATFKVEPSSDLIRIVEQARSIVASGSLAAGALAGAGTSYPQTAPNARRGGIGRM